jgi:hypothetical protein
LDRSDVASDGDGEIGGGVTEIVNPKPDQIRVRLYEGPDSGQPDGPAESDERSGPPRGAVDTGSSWKSGLHGWPDGVRRNGG